MARRPNPEATNAHEGRREPPKDWPSRPAEADLFSRRGHFGEPDWKTAPARRRRRPWRSGGKEGSNLEGPWGTKKSASQGGRLCQAGDQPDPPAARDDPGKKPGKTATAEMLPVQKAAPWISREYPAPEGNRELSYCGKRTWRHEQEEAQPDDPTQPHARSRFLLPGGGGTKSSCSDHDEDTRQQERKPERGRSSDSQVSARCREEGARHGASRRPRSVLQGGAARFSGG